MVSPIFFFSKVPVFNVLCKSGYALLSNLLTNQQLLIIKEVPVRLCLFTPIYLKLSKNRSYPSALIKPSTDLSLSMSPYIPYSLISSINHKDCLLTPYIIS